MRGTDLFAGEDPEDLFMRKGPLKPSPATVFARRYPEKRNICLQLAIYIRCAVNNKKAL